MIFARVARRCGAILLAIAAGGMTPSLLSAQTLVVEGPTQSVLPSITPSLVLRALGMGPTRPIQYTVQLSTTADFSAIVLDSSFSSVDTVRTVQITRPLPSEALVYWRATARAFAGPLIASAPSSSRLVPAWLTLMSPNSPEGNAFDVRRPLFVWRSAAITPAIGPWRYELEILSAGRPELGAVGLRDTVFRPSTDLQANTSYRWNVRAYLGTGESVRSASIGTFVITDPPLPTTTLLYQNFPNPFPSDASFATCFWFDVGEDGARIALDVLDLRGNLVKRIVPGTDGVEQFQAGRYGRGAPGASSNCDNRFVWDGTAADGRTVAPGVFLARFRANNGAPTVRRIVFRGR